MAGTIYVMMKQYFYLKLLNYHVMISFLSDYCLIILPR